MVNQQPVNQAHLTQPITQTKQEKTKKTIKSTNSNTGSRTSS